jgi:TatD DNase family protein
VFYDTHAHLDDPQFAGDLPDVIQRAHEAGVTRILAVGTDLESSRRALEISGQFDGVYAAIGWHPSHVMQAPDDVCPELRRLAEHPKVVAIGEIGLDYHRLPEGNADEIERVKHKQSVVFRQQLELAAALGLNCIVHQRDCFEDVLSHLEPFAGRTRGVLHCFVNGPADMERVISIGSLVSFTGIATYKNAQLVRETVAVAPPGRFMLETDCPYLVPVPFRGRQKRCEPAFVKEIAGLIATVKRCGLEELSEMTCQAAADFFPKLA